MNLSKLSDFLESSSEKSHTRSNADSALKEMVEVGVVIVTGWIVP